MAKSPGWFLFTAQLITRFTEFGLTWTWNIKRLQPCDDKPLLQNNLPKFYHVQTNVYRFYDREQSVDFSFSKQKLFLKLGLTTSSFLTLCQHRMSFPTPGLPSGWLTVATSVWLSAHTHTHTHNCRCGCPSAPRLTLGSASGQAVCPLPGALHQLQRLAAALLHQRVRHFFVGEVNLWTVTFL